MASFSNVSSDKKQVKSEYRVAVFENPMVPGGKEFCAKNKNVWMAHARLNRRHWGHQMSFLPGISSWNVLKRRRSNCSASSAPMCDVSTSLCVTRLSQYL